ncbi:hypothetical protein B1NLA3E_19050 [Bacillus sp. 1NLA3E]|nr:hypothetical protein B1NLA3E_19050 [Bacillus sp. 1NLA3E]
MQITPHVGELIQMLKVNQFDPDHRQSFLVLSMQRHRQNFDHNLGFFYLNYAILPINFGQYLLQMHFQRN